MWRILWEEEKLLVSHRMFQLEESGALFAAVEICFKKKCHCSCSQALAGPTSFDSILVAHASYWLSHHTVNIYCEHLEILYLDLCLFSFYRNKKKQEKTPLVSY